LVDAEVHLFTQTHPELWDAWDAPGDVDLAMHTRALRERYGFSIAGA
jgi:hypothetical protein